MMRKTVRLFSEQGPQERLAEAVAALPRSAQLALAGVAERTDLPLVAGAWNDGGSGCLVANVVAIRTGGATDASDTTLDLRILDLMPELSSRDLNRLIVAWDTAADQDGAADDGQLRDLLRGALDKAGVQLPAIPPEWGRHGSTAAGFQASDSEKIEAPQATRLVSTGAR